jgi:hypothetical protein
MLIPSFQINEEFEHEENKSVEQELFKVDPGHEYG